MSYEAIQDIDSQLFRAYDIRGMVDHTLTSDAVYTIARAIGSEARMRSITTLVVGRDGRLSGPELLAALVAGLRDSGINVIDCGMVPTPVLYYAIYHLKIYSGVMLTGSHNPANYNGLKTVLAKETLAEGAIDALYQRAVAQDFVGGQGSYQKRDDMTDLYIQEVAKQCQLPRPLHIVIDCGNGVTGAVAPKLYRAMGAKVTELFTDVDGHFPNHHPDPTRPKNLQDIMRVVVAEGADIGLAFDGDGDRCGVVTEQAENIWADRQMMWFAQDVLQRNPGATILYDVKCTQHLASVIKESGGQPLMWKTGHSLMKAKSQEIGAPLAGEMSGHIFFKDGWYGFDDGMYTGARMSLLLAAQQQPLSEIFAAFPDSINTPELKLKVPEEQKFELMKKIAQQAHFAEALETIKIDGLRVHFAKGWGLIRPSNTTPCLILRFEAETEADLEWVQDQFRSQLLWIDSALTLPF